MEGTLTTPPQISNMAPCAKMTSHEAITMQVSVIQVIPSPTNSPISGNYRVQLNYYSYSITIQTNLKRTHQ